MAITAAEMNIILSVKDQATQAFQSVQREMEGLGERLSGVGQKMASLGSKMSVAVTAPLVLLGKQGVSAAADFESQLNVMSLAARSSGTSLDTLREAAITVGGDTRLVGINAANAAEAMTNFYKAGLTTTQIMGDLDSYLTRGTELTGALRAAIDLAAASELNLASASDIVAIAMATFGLDASESNRITDAFIRAADASVTTVSELADAMSTIGPTAASFGWSLEDTNTALAILSQRGIRGAEAGTALKSMMTNLMQPTKDTVKTLKSLGVTLYDTEGRMRSLPDIIGQLSDALTVGAERAGTMTEEQRNAAVQTLAGTYGMKAMNTLLAEGTEGWKAMEAAIGAAASTQESAAARTRGFSAAMEVLSGVIETLTIRAITPFLENTLTPLARRLTEIIDRISEINPKFLDMAVKIVAVVAVAGPALLIIGKLVTTIGMLASPIGLAIAGIALLTAAFVNSQGGIENTISKLSLVAEWLRDHITAAVSVAAGFWTGTLLPALQVVWAFLQSSVIPVFATVFAWLQEKLPVAGQTLSAFWTNTLLPALQGAWSFLQGSVIPVFETVLGWMKEKLPVAAQTLSDAWTNRLLPALKKVWAFIEDPLFPLFRALADFLSAVFEWTLKSLTDTLSDFVLPAFRSVWEMIQDHVLPILHDLWGKITSTLQPALTSIWEVIQDKVLLALGNLVGNVKENMLPVFQKLGDTIGGVRGLLEGFIGMLNRAADAIRNLPSLPDFLQRHSPSPFEQTLAGIAELLPLVVQGLRDMGDSIPDADKLRDTAYAIQAMFGGIGGTVTAMTAIGGYTPVEDIRERVTALIEDARVVSREFARYFKLWTEETFANVEKAGAGAEVWQTLFQPIRSIIDGIVALAEYQSVADIRGKVTALIEDARVVSREFARYFKLWTEETFANVEKAGAGAKVWQVLFQPIKSIVDGVVSLAEYQSVADIRGKVTALVEDARVVSREFARYFKLWTEDTFANVRKAGAGAETWQVLFQPIKGIVDGISALAQYQAIADVRDKVTALVEDARIVSRAFAQYFKLWTEETFANVEKAGAGAALWQTLFQPIRDIVDGIKAVARYQRAKDIKTDVERMIADARLVSQALATYFKRWTDTTFVNVGQAAAGMEVWEKLFKPLRDMVDALQAIANYRNRVRPTLSQINAVVNDLKAISDALQAGLTDIGEEARMRFGNVADAMTNIRTLVESTIGVAQGLSEMSWRRISEQQAWAFVGNLRNVVVWLSDPEKGLPSIEDLDASAYVDPVESVGIIVGTLVNAIRAIQTLPFVTADKLSNFTATVHALFATLSTSLAGDVPGVIQSFLETLTTGFDLRAAEFFAIGQSVGQQIMSGLYSALNDTGVGGVISVGMPQPGMPSVTLAPRAINVTVHVEGVLLATDAEVTQIARKLAPALTTELSRAGA